MMKTYKILLSFLLVLVTSLGFSQSVPSYVPTNGLVGWWGFNGNAQDGSGNGNHIVNNSCTFTLNRFGQINSAIDLVGPNKWLGGSVIQTTVQPVLPNLSTSMSMWCKVVNISFGEIYHQGTGSSGFGLYLQGGSTLLGTKLFVLDNGVNGNVTNIQNGGFDLGLGQWKHIVLSKVGNQVDLYINGLFHSNGFLSLNAVNSGWLNFGVPDIGEGNVDVHLDDIGIWNRALTPQEITNLYNSQVSQPCTTSVTTNHNINGCGFAILANGDTVTQSGNYLDTLSSSGGCDSILNQTVTIQPTSFCNPVPTYVPANGLVGWWGFNGNAQDNSGNGNHGTVNGATLTTDRFGNQFSSYDFDGNDWINVAQDFSSGNNPKSFSVWFKLDESTYNWILSGGVSSNSHAFGLYTENQRIWFHGDGHTTFDYNFSNITINSWHHVAITYGLGVIKAYLNGIYIGQHSIVLNTISNHISFGRRNNGTAYLNGKIDDIGIWNRTLTPQEITNLYNSQLPTQTSLCLPTITTSSPTSVGVDTVVIGGDISNDGGSSIVLRGVCYSTTPNPNMGNSRTEDGSGIGSFNTILRGLNPSTTYYARSYAKNSNGVVVYGNEVTFTTTASLPGVRCPGIPTVTDIDGNVYNTVQIGNQCWTQSNLKTSKYRNGDNIPTGLNNSAWSSTLLGAYSIYDNDLANDALYGKLYNHYSVSDSRGLCPTGWHVPSDGEWTTLVNYLGGASVAGGSLKSTAMQPTPGGWASPNAGAINSSGYSALASGFRLDNGAFNYISYYTKWWSSTLISGFNAWYRNLDYDHSFFGRSNDYVTYGFSVRCLKD